MTNPWNIGIDDVRNGEIDGRCALTGPPSDARSAVPFSRRVIAVDSGHLVRLRGELDMAAATDLLDWLVEIAGSKLIIDLSELTFMDSSGVAVMAQAKDHLGDALVLSRPRSNVRRVFELTGLADWLTDWNPEWSPESQHASVALGRRVRILANASDPWIGREGTVVWIGRQQGPPLVSDVRFNDPNVRPAVFAVSELEVIDP
jgi:anti-sigma B factor antagonist